MGPNYLMEYDAANEHRVFPLADTATGISTDGNQLANSILVGMLLSVPPGVSAVFYVSQVVVTSSVINVTISADGVPVAECKNIPIHTVGSSYTAPVVPIENTTAYPVTGSIIRGSCNDAVSGVYDLTADTGLINSVCIVFMQQNLSAIIVGDSILTGDVVLEEGNNLTISVSRVGSVSTITFNYSPPEGMISSNAELLEAITAAYGVPITTINGITPTAEGNFYMNADSCTTITSGTNNIVLSNPCAKPCCDKSFLDTAYANISDLNARANVIDSLLNSMTSAINDIQNQLSILKLGINQE